MNSFVNKVPPIKFTKDLIQKVDIAMVGRFWYAAQYYVDKNFKNLEKGSDAYYKKVAEYFDRSIEETQSTNMVMENADIMRNPSGGMKMITMFMGQGLQNFGIVYDNLANMRAKAKAAIEKAVSDQKVFEGRVCSGDQFISSKEVKDSIKSTFGGECVEMEGAGIAQACHLNNVPFLIIRAISDKADGSKMKDYIDFENKAARDCAAATLELLKSL